MLPKTAGSWVQLPNDGGMIYRPQKLFKKGGKILKAERGEKFFGKSMDNQGAYGSFDVTPVSVTATGTFSRPVIDLKGNISGVSRDTNLEARIGTTTKPAMDAKREEFLKNIKTNSVVSTGNTSNRRSSINPKNILDLGSLAGGLISNARQRRELARGIRAAAQGQLKSMPTEIYAPYTDMGIARMYGDRIKDIRQFKTVTSDPNQVMAERLMRDQQADQLAAERDTKLSQTISEFNDRDIAARREYANQRTQIADYNRAVLGQMENMLAQNKAAKQFTAWNQIINPFIDQKRDDLVRDQYEDQ
nr:MAG TPA: hypothetical protein [Caudoviricetes sp.]